MTRWHQTLAANLGLRACGLSLLGVGWIIGAAFARHVHAAPLHEATLPDLAACTLLVASVLAGGVLLAIGPGLWRRVDVPGRRSFTLPSATPSDGTLTSEREIPHARSAIPASPRARDPLAACPDRSSLVLT